jgi:hypothetical protein
MDINRITHKVIQRLISESQEEREMRGKRRMTQAEGLAAYRYKELGMLSIVVYEKSAILNNIEALKNGTLSPTNAAVTAMRGIIQIGQPEYKCNGAWEVKFSAVKNKGDGGIIYGLGYAMAPKGILTSDRYEVSDSAAAGWAKQVSRGGEPFDDADLPKKRRRTPDKSSDDCVLHQPEEKHSVLNRSYEEEGWEKGLLETMQAAHKETMDQLDPALAKRIKDTWVDEFDSFFNRHYRHS